MIQEQLSRLYELSQLDLKVREIRQRIAHVPVRREELQSSLKGKEESLQVKQQRQASLEKQKRDLEGELQMSMSRLTELQTKVNQIKTNREYQAALKEIADTKKGNKEVEDRVLALMTELEGLNGQIESEGKVCESEKATASSALQALEGEEKTIEEEVKGFVAKRDELCAGIEAKWLAQYERIRGSREEGVAVVQQGTCQGCHMNIPPQLFIEIQKFRVIYTCPWCQRILYLPGGAS